MNKEKTSFIILTIFVMFILLFFFMRIFIYDRNIVDDRKIYNEKITLNNNDINVSYQEGKDLDIKLIYGNIDTRLISLTNNNDTDVVYALKYSTTILSNEDVYYDLYISTDNKDFKQLVKGKRLIDNSYLIYNLVLNKNATNYIKIVFKSLHENEETIIKGNVVITDNISSLDLFNISVNNLRDALEERVNRLNGIYKNGYYYLNINELEFVNDASIKGFIIVDADDISDIRYSYIVYNDKYMIKNYEYKNINVVNVDNELVNSLDHNKACSLYDTRVKCTNFINLPKNTKDEKKEFVNKTKQVIKQFELEFDKDDDKTYVYDISKDITNDTNIEGYILKNKDNMFIYLKNNLYMISGYNYGKIGEFDSKSSTVRSYNLSAFELSAKDKNTVCSFSGYEECYDKDGQLLGGY